MRRSSSLGVLLAAAFAFCADDPPKTAAEATEYKATSTHAEVLAFCKRLADSSPRVRMLEMGRSVEGRALPMLVISDPPIASAEDARRSGKLILFALGNIHAGEVDGKEALLMLARQLAGGPRSPLFDRLTFVFAPIFNADGNERMREGNRPGQAGPSVVGVRPNARGLDLNRDFVKLESPEVTGLVRTFHEWNPHVFIDLHTTNGSYHRYTLTYEGGGCLAGDARIVDYVRGKLLPDVSARMEKATGYKSTYYGNFSRDRKLWETIPPTPRYGFHYFGLRNRFSILSESYSYASFMHRVAASKAFVTAIAEFAAERHAEIHRMLADAETAARSPAAEATLVLDAKAVPFGKPFPLLGFVEEPGPKGRKRPTEKHQSYEVTYTGAAEPTIVTPRAFAYVIPAGWKTVADNLRTHGVEVETLTAPADATVEIQRITKIERGRAFQGHQNLTLTTETRTETRTLPAGSFVVRNAQPLGPLAGYFLEPRSADGLATWNFFDRELAEGKDFPVVRLPKAVELKTGAAK